MKILQLTAHFRPNIGGVETHLDDLCKSLVKRGFEVTVLTYRPLQTKTTWKLLEKKKNLEIFRIPWIPNLFYKLISAPILEFLYLLPGLFLITPFIVLTRSIEVINAHGLVAGFVGVFWGKIFGKRIVVSTHSIYNFPKKGLYSDFVSWIFNNADYCLGLSKQAVEEIGTLAVPAKKIGNFTYWIDLNKFKVKNEKLKIKKELKWNKDFVVLFVGRLVSEKGIDVLLQAAKSWRKEIKLKICGIGPMERNIRLVCKKQKNVEYLESIDQNRLPLYYNGSDILIVPSTSEEGFGRVILEALACGIPVAGAKRGGILEAIDSTVGKLIDINPESIKETVEYFYIHKEKLRKLAKNCRRYAERRYSEKNVETIIKSYTN